MTVKNSACRCSRLSASLIALIAGFGQMPAVHATGSALPVTGLGTSASGNLSLAADGDGSESDDLEFYLEVVLNQAATGRLARFIMRDGRFFASASTLREIGLRWSGSEDAQGLQPLDAIPGLQADYDAAYQRMRLNVPVALLDREPTRLGIAPTDAPRPDPAMRAPGLILNYDLQAQHGNDYDSLAGWSELRLFGLGPGLWSNTLSNRLSSGSQGGSGHDSVRLDTSWQLDFPETMVTLAIGDGITGAVPWSRATRIGGIRLSRNFALQPYRVTAPLASFAGEAALPSTVDLLINGIRQSSQQVAPGQFQIDSTPLLSGAGSAQLVVTDINGISRVLDFSLYGTPRLLETGLSDWSLDVGVVRRNYGLESFAYAGDPMFSGSLRHGLNDHLTLETHAEATSGLEMAGIGGTWLPGLRTGTISAAIAHSRADTGNGRMHSLGYHWQSRIFSFNASSARHSAGFRDVASLEGSPLPRRTEQVFAGLNSPLGQWNVSYIRQQYPDSAPSRYATLGWSRQLPYNSRVNLQLSRDLESDRGYGAFLAWSIPLDRHTSVTMGARHDRDSQSLTVDASRSMPGDLGGWGWRAASTVGSGTRNAQAQIGQLGRYGQWVAGVNHWSGGGHSSNTAYAGANGGLLWMGGQTYAMRRVDDAFAVISTEGVAGVPVRLENRLVGHTDDNGLLLINRLNAWQYNRLSIDPLALPPDIYVERTELAAVPAGRSGLLARFPMRPILSLQVELLDPAGQPLPAGSPVWLQDADPSTEPATTVVGHDGLLYLQDPPRDARLRIRANGDLCSVTLPDLPQSGGFAALDGVVCR